MNCLLRVLLIQQLVSTLANKNYKMDKESIFKIVVILISTIIFFLQLNHSLEKLANPPLADVSLTTTLSTIDPLPLITVCPLNQINEGKVQEFGYRKTSYFLKGVKNIGEKEQLSWGADLNKTFDEMLDLVLDVSTQNHTGLHVNELEESRRIIDKYTHKLKMKFYIEIWGYCWDLEEYDITNALEFYFKPIREFRIYITDKSLKTFYRFHGKSLRGQSILTNSDNRHWFEIDIEKMSHFDPNNPDHCVDYKDNMFARCVDEQVQSTVKQHLGCNILWMCATNQCSQVVNITDIEAYMNIVNPFVYGDDILFDDMCTHPCNLTLFTARLRKTYPDFGNSIKISFAKEVPNTQKIVTYDFSNFLVDIGKI